MGFNTTVVILNDHIHSIGDDPTFGRSLYNAVTEVWSRRDKRPIVMDHQVRVIETHHADSLVPVLVGGNTGEVVRGSIGYGAYEAGEEARHLMLVKSMAEALGYRLVKKGART